ncbi:MAG: SGNH hydrolase domain-containing protein [Bacteroidota bacterium]|nr:SGNH hydrolase domain-containing protein [Bacteroidota bacterium]
MQLYYLPHLRFMQIMSGAALAIYLHKNEGFSLGKASTWIGVFSLLGMVILFFTKDLFTVKTYGVLFLLVSILTVLLILANKENNIVKTIFSNNVVVWIGKISYSLYLWHWVVLALLRYLYQESVLPTSYVIISIVVMFGLSVVTYYFVEEPIRKNKFSFKKNLVLFYILPSIVVLGLFYKIKYTPPTLIASEFLYPQNICHNNLEKGCIKGDLTKEPNVLVVGDSYIGQLNSFIDIVGKNEGWSAFVTSSDKCSFAFGYYKGYSSYCKTRNQYVGQNYAKYDKIVFHYYNSEYYNDKFRATCKRLLEEGKQLYESFARPSVSFF